MMLKNFQYTTNLTTLLFVSKLMRPAPWPKDTYGCPVALTLLANDLMLANSFLRTNALSRYLVSLLCGLYTMLLLNGAMLVPVQKNLYLMARPSGSVTTRALRMTKTMSGCERSYASKYRATCSRPTRASSITHVRKVQRSSKCSSTMRRSTLNCPRPNASYSRRGMRASSRSAGVRDTCSSTTNITASSKPSLLLLLLLLLP